MSFESWKQKKKISGTIKEKEEGEEELLTKLTRS